MQCKLNPGQFLKDALDQSEMQETREAEERCYVNDVI